VSLTLVNSFVGGGQDEEREGGGGYVPTHHFFGPSIWILPSPYYSYGYHDPYGTEQYEERPKRQMSFFEAVYSFVFGDGNPNFNVEERRYQMLAQVIRNNDGAVVAEQLAPYLDPNDGWLEREDDAHVDEAFVTPVLTRFNGRAEVTDEGDIVYVFDDLRSTSGGATGMTAVGDFLEEQETGFSRATTGQKWGAGLLGALNVFGVLKMGTLVAVLTKLKLKGYTLGAFWGGVAAAYPFIAAYAAVYVATPVIRCLMNAFTNAAVNKRNEARWVAAGQLANMNSSTRRKIEGSKRFKGEERAIRAEDAVFRSDVDATMQKSLDEDKFADFDRRLGTA
jgi:hypothetical protein